MKALQLLSPKCAWVGDGGLVSIKPRKVQALLALIALNRTGESRTALAAMLWEDCDDAHARHSLNQCVHELRRTIKETGEPIVRSCGDRLELDRSVVRLDVDEFEEAIRQGTLEALSRVGDLYSSDLLTGLKLRSDPFDCWLGTERRRLRDLACQAFLKSTVLHAAEGALDDAIASAKRAVELDATCESAHRWLMRCYADCGDHPAAERQYQLCSVALDREYGLAPEVETVELREKIRGCRQVPPLRSQPVWRRPAVEVNTFADDNADGDSSHFARALAGEVATAMHRWTGIDVVCPQLGAVASLSGRPTGEAGAVEDRARYAIQGTVRKSGARVRVVVQLLDRLTSNQVWADRYDRRVQDVVTVQDEITSRIAGAVEPEIQRHEANICRRNGIDQRDAVDLFRLGQWHLQRHNAGDNEKAVECFRRSAQIDPRFIQAQTGLGCALLAGWSYGWSKDVARDRNDLFGVIEAAIALDHNDPYCHYLAAATSLFTRRHQDALAAAASAVELNPYFALGHYLLGHVCLLAGWPEAAAEAINMGLRLDPRNVELPRWLTVLSCAEYQLRHYDKAALLALAAVRRRVSASSYIILAAAYGQLGRLADASTAFFRCRRIAAARLAPVEQPAFTRFRDVRHIVDGLARAGIRFAAEKPPAAGARASQIWRVSQTPIDDATPYRSPILITRPEQVAGPIELTPLWPSGETFIAEGMPASLDTINLKFCQ
jgi:DNA-binding SARP family transcriptional activator